MKLPSVPVFPPFSLSPFSPFSHGEAYKPGEGPNLHLRCSVPRGRFQLSLYFFETDWIQYRNFDLAVYSDDKAHQLLAKTSVGDFAKGKHKRFAVIGPCKLHIEILRGNSTNVVLSGLFLDPLPATAPTSPVKEKSAPAESPRQGDDWKVHPARRRVPQSPGESGPAFDPLQFATPASWAVGSL